MSEGVDGGHGAVKSSENLQNIPPTVPQTAYLLSYIDALKDPTIKLVLLELAGERLQQIQTTGETEAHEKAKLMAAYDQHLKVKRPAAFSSSSEGRSQILLKCAGRADNMTHKSILLQLALEEIYKLPDGIEKTTCMNEYDTLFEKFSRIRTPEGG